MLEPTFDVTSRLRRLYFLAPESPGERRHSFFDNLSRLAGVSRAGSVGVPGKHLFCGCWGESLLAKSRAQPRDLCFESVICRVNVMNVVNVGEHVKSATFTTYVHENKGPVNVVNVVRKYFGSRARSLPNQFSNGPREPRAGESKIAVSFSVPLW